MSVLLNGLSKQHSRLDEIYFRRFSLEYILILTHYLPSKSIGSLNLKLTLRQSWDAIIMNFENDLNFLKKFWPVLFRALQIWVIAKHFILARFRAGTNWDVRCLQWIFAADRREKSELLTALRSAFGVSVWPVLTPLYKKIMSRATDNYYFGLYLYCTSNFGTYRKFGPG